MSKTTGWSKYVLEEDREKPESEQRSLEIRPIKVKHMIKLAAGAESHRDNLLDKTSDEDYRSIISETSEGVIYNLMLLTLSTRRFINFGEEEQDTFTAFFESDPMANSVFPYWYQEVAKEVTKNMHITEDEAKNSEGPSATE